MTQISAKEAKDLVEKHNTKCHQDLLKKKEEYLKIAFREIEYRAQNGGKIINFLHSVRPKDVFYYCITDVPTHLSTLGEMIKEELTSLGYTLEIDACREKFMIKW